MTTNKKNMVITGVLVLVMGVGCLSYYLEKEPIDKIAKDPLMETGDMLNNAVDDLTDVAMPVINTDGEILDDVDAEDVFFSGKNNYFLDYRFEREETRATEMNAINELIVSEQTDKEVKQRAEEKIYEITENMEKELHIEGLIKAKGYDDAVVMIGEETVSAVIKKSTLSEEDTTIILDILTKETSRDAHVMSIIPHK